MPLITNHANTGYKYIYLVHLGMYGAKLRNYLLINSSMASGEIKGASF